MTRTDSIHSQRLSVLGEAERLGNVSEACRRHGLSRTLFYRLRQRLEAYGPGGVHPKGRGAPSPGAPSAPTRPTAGPRCAFALVWPTCGPQWFSDQRAGEGVTVAPVTIWRLCTGIAWGPDARGWPCSSSTVRPPRAAHRAPRRVLTDNGKEFKGAFADGCDRLGIRVTRTKPRHAWTNGFVERLQKTILHEHWRIAFRRHYFTGRRSLQGSLDRFMQFYNEERTIVATGCSAVPADGLSGGVAAWSPRTRAVILATYLSSPEEPHADPASGSRIFRNDFAHFPIEPGGTTVALGNVTGAQGGFLVSRIRSVVLSTLVYVLLAAARASGAQITLAWDPNPEVDVTGYVVEYGPTSAPFTTSVDIGKITTWTLGNLLPGATYAFRVVAYNGNGERSDPSAALVATPDGSPPAPAPALTADRASLAFGIISGAPQIRTGAQRLRLTQTGASAIVWTASTSAPWLQVFPASGSGSGILAVSLVSGAVPPSGSSTATIAIAATGASNTIAPIHVSLKVISTAASTAPVGLVDSPADNVTGVTGSIAITGWAVDDVDVTRIRILRDPVAGESASELVFVGNATLVEDARPDVAAAFPSNPQSVRAGFGYLLLSNVLPGLGNGTFRLSVYADDVDGHSTLLGVRRITCANSSATQPFGAIDTPAPDETVAGSIYTSFGWVLARGSRRADVPGGGNVTALIDGVAVGSPIGWSARQDLSSLFPAAQYPGVTSALAAFTFDTTTLTNGIHTMAWVVLDNQGGAAGIGSRYFRVFNGTAAPAAAIASSISSGGHLTLDAEIAAAVTGGSAVEARRGYALDLPFRRYEPDTNGRVTLHAEELDRVEILTNGATDGYLVFGDALRPLPIGSQLDGATGAFVWQPGVGFVGTYDLAFVRRGSAGGALIRHDVRIVLNPKGSNRVGPQIVVDVAPGSIHGEGGLVVAGWAADLDSPTDRGIDTIHVWAYPAAGGDPLFVGEASYGGRRPDVAAVYGDRFGATGYGIRVGGLAPGAYDLAVFAWSSAKHNWLPAKLVRICIK